MVFTRDVDQVYCIYYTDGELVISQNQMSLKVVKQL